MAHRLPDSSTNENQHWKCGFFFPEMVGLKSEA